LNVVDRFDIDLNMSKSSSAQAVGQSGSTRINTTARISQVLRRRIEAGEWGAGEKLPSEPALAVELGASRGSLRGALATLESEGLLVRRHGAGTFVNARQPLVNSLHRNTSADQMITSTGRVAGTSYLSWRKTAADAEIARRLDLEEGADIFELYRVRTADGVPVTVSYDYLSADLLPDQPALLGPSLYAFLASTCGVEVAFGVADLIPTVADVDIARALEVEPGALCLLMQQVDYDSIERPVSFSVEFHLASAFRFELVRRGPASSALSDQADLT
jgi:GntR family transcriptional regulator